MKRYNVIAVYSPDETQLLMCQRAKEPYKGMLNFVGGKVESGETDEEAAYRELYEETGITRRDIVLTHVMDFVYYQSNLILMLYAGKLHQPVPLTEERNRLLWIDRTENFCDVTRFAGDCNIDHMLRQIEFYREETLR